MELLLLMAQIAQFLQVTLQLLPQLVAVEVDHNQVQKLVLLEVLEAVVLTTQLVEMETHQP